MSVISTVNTTKCHGWNPANPHCWILFKFNPRGFSKHMVAAAGVSKAAKYYMASIHVIVQIIYLVMYMQIYTYHMICIYHYTYILMILIHIVCIKHITEWCEKYVWVGESSCYHDWLVVEHAKTWCKHIHLQKMLSGSYPEGKTTLNAVTWSFLKHASTWNTMNFVVMIKHPK